MNIGEQIREYRKKSGLSQKELGEKLGVSQAMIAQYESGKRIPKIETLKKIADSLGVSISTLRPLDISPEELGRITGQRGNRLRIYSSEPYDGPPIDLFEEVRLAQIEDFMINLNEKGQEKAVEQVELLTKIPEYKKNSDSTDKHETEIKAAHNNFASDPNEQRKMREDISNLKKSD